MHNGLLLLLYMRKYSQEVLTLFDGGHATSAIVVSSTFYANGLNMCDSITCIW